MSSSASCGPHVCIRAAHERFVSANAEPLKTGLCGEHPSQPLALRILLQCKHVSINAVFHLKVVCEILKLSHC